MPESRDVPEEVGMRVKKAHQLRGLKRTIAGLSMRIYECPNILLSREYLISKLKECVVNQEWNCVDGSPFSAIASGKVDPEVLIGIE